MKKEYATKDSLVLRLRVLQQALCLGEAFNKPCDCARVGKPGATGCKELKEAIAILEAMTDSEFDYIKWTHAVETTIWKS